MTIDTQKLLSLFDTAAQAYGWAGGTGTVGQFQTALTNYQKARGDLEQALEAQEAEIARLRDALAEIVAAADGDGWSQLDPSFEKARAALSGESHE
ncbi:hypothetical protein ABRZ04_05380 [Castellaniella ginsengisoli]|uniref:Uncharacterized protein n=1 Tax=Castellaniella ginsengisoli TaxID=546114 RepID=A0AB39D3C0_9BURK